MSQKTPAQAKLDALLREGILPNITEADGALLMVTTIGSRADQLNAAQFGPVMAQWQHVAKQAYILSLTRLFDRPSKTYATLTLRRVPIIIEEHAADLVPISPADAVRVLRKLDQSTQIHAALRPDEFSRQTAVMVNKALCQHCGRVDRALRWLRNKKIAHTDGMAASSIGPGATWGDAAQLLEFAKDIADLIGHGYLGTTPYRDDSGRWILDREWEGIRLAMERFLDAALAGREIVDERKMAELEQRVRRGTAAQTPVPPTRP
jgi:hypothetical protein